MGRNKKITALQMYFVLTLSIGISNHVLMIPVLLQIAKRDAWIGAISAWIPLLAWICILYFIVKRVGNHKTTDWIKMKFGKASAYLVILVLSVYCLLIAAVSLKDTITWTNVTYLPNSPKFVIAVAFMLVCFFAAKAGIRAIAITSGILLPGVVVLGYVVMIANFQYKDYSLLLPIFTHGYGSALKASMYTFGGLIEMIFILFMQHQVSSKIRFSSLIILSVFLMGLTVAPLTGSIAIFGPFEAAILRYPAFEQWRMVTIGKFLSHLDFFSIFQWISGSFIRISLMMYLIIDLFGITRQRGCNLFLIGLSVITLVLALYPISDVLFFRQLTDWYFPIVLGVNLFITVLLLMFAVLPGKRKEKEMK